MRYGSVCSGIEAATAAWHPLEWKPVFFSEIEPFPCAVLAHHYPHVPNLGDMTKFKEWPDAIIDVLVGGTPCQSYSVAGLRAGLGDQRGNLMLTYVAIARKYRPKWVVWENVPGVLSSNEGRDFGSLLGLLTGQHVVCPPTGWQNSGVVPGIKGAYGIAWRILDAQYFGVAQRRRRVFVVGYLGDWRRAAAVLFERDSLCGNSAPRREKREEVAGTLGARTSGGGFPGSDEAMSGYVQPVHTTGAGFWQEGFGTLRAREQDSHENLICMSTGQAGAEIGIGIGTTLNCNHEAPVVCFESRFARNGRGAPSEICPPLKAENGGTGKGDGAPLVASAAMQVRRLMPVECERLQGFPDHFTNIPWRKKPESPDGPRYKALGNSMAVPCMRWIGERIALVDSL